MNRHYNLDTCETDAWQFTSPMGLHVIRNTYEEAEKCMAKVRARHLEKSRQIGTEAAILRAWFEPESSSQNELRK